MSVPHVEPSDTRRRPRPHEAPPRARGSVFSIDYLVDAIGALDAAKADRVTLSFGDELPIRIQGEWVEWGFTVTFTLGHTIG